MNGPSKVHEVDQVVGRARRWVATLRQLVPTMLAAGAAALVVAVAVGGSTSQLRPPQVRRPGVGETVRPPPARSPSAAGGDITVRLRPDPVPVPSRALPDTGAPDTAGPGDQVTVPGFLGAISLGVTAPNTGVAGRARPAVLHPSEPAPAPGTPPEPAPPSGMDPEVPPATVVVAEPVPASAVAAEPDPVVPGALEAPVEPQRLKRPKRSRPGRTTATAPAKTQPAAAGAPSEPVGGAGATDHRAHARGNDGAEGDHGGPTDREAAEASAGNGNGRGTGKDKDKAGAKAKAAEADHHHRRGGDKGGGKQKHERW